MSDIGFVDNHCVGEPTTMSDIELMEAARHYLVPSLGCFPRRLAAEILSRFASFGEFGGRVKDFEPFIIGVAVRRILPNYGETDDETSVWDQFLMGLDFDEDTDELPAK